MANSIGVLGENLALDYLKKKNYHLVDRNFRSRYGEIDLICEKNNTLFFVEVKTRIGTTKGMPYEAVNTIKLAHLKKAIYYYLIINSSTDRKLRVDVISIILAFDRSVVEIRHLENVEVE